MVGYATDAIFEIRAVQSWMKGLRFQFLHGFH